MKPEKLTDLPQNPLQKYLRIKHLMHRYGCSRGHINNLMKDGVLPPAMKIRGVQCWPLSVIEEIDRRRDAAYFESLKSQGFEVPEDALAS